MRRSQNLSAGKPDHRTRASAYEADGSGRLDIRPILTKMEYRVLALVTQGDSNKEIACAIGISPATVKRHIENLLEKLNLRNRVEAAVYGAIVEGLTGGGTTDPRVPVSPEKRK